MEVGDGAGQISAAPPAIVPPPPRPPRPSVVRVGGTVQESKLIRKVLPVHPEIMLRARISGDVLLEVAIDEEGNVAGISVLRGRPLLTDAAVQAVSRWKCSPTLLNGEPVTAVKVVWQLRWGGETKRQKGSRRDGEAWTRLLILKTLQKRLALSRPGKRRHPFPHPF